MQQTKLVLGVLLRQRSREDLQVWIGEASRLLPLCDPILGPRCEKDAGSFRAALSFGLRLHSLHVVAHDLVLGAVEALGEGFVAANVSPFASLAAFATFGVAPS